MSDAVHERSSPERIAIRASEIYEDLGAEIKRDNTGKFMVVDVKTKHYFISEFSDEAFRLAREGSPHGIFHLIRIGARSAFKVSFSTGHDANGSWPL